MKNKLYRMTKQFLLNETFVPSAKMYLQSLNDLVEQIKPTSKRDSHRLQLAKENIVKLRRHFRKMEEHVSTLEEQLKVLEEDKEIK